MRGFKVSVCMVGLTAMVVVVAICVGIIGSARGSPDPANQPPPPYPRGYQQITSLSSATSLTVPTGAQIAWIQAESQNIRLRDDGTAPSATVGFIITTTDPLRYDGDLRDVQLIEVTGSAKVNILYYGS